MTNIALKQYFSQQKEKYLQETIHWYCCVEISIPLSLYIIDFCSEAYSSFIGQITGKARGSVIVVRVCSTPP